jgi:hypothetical protein
MGAYKKKSVIKTKGLGYMISALSNMDKQNIKEKKNLSQLNFVNEITQLKVNQETL